MTSYSADEDDCNFAELPVKYRERGTRDFRSKGTQNRSPAAWRRLATHSSFNTSSGTSTLTPVAGISSLSVQSTPCVTRRR